MAEYIMSSDIYLLILGALFGLLSALLLEIARHWLSQKRQKAEEKKINQKKEQEAVTAFLTQEEVQKSLGLVTVKKNAEVATFRAQRRRVYSHT